MPCPSWGDRGSQEPVSGMLSDVQDAWTPRWAQDWMCDPARSAHSLSGFRSRGTQDSGTPRALVPSCLSCFFFVLSLSSVSMSTAGRVLPGGVHLCPGPLGRLYELCINHGQFCIGSRTSITPTLSIRLLNHRPRLMTHVVCLHCRLAFLGP